MTCRHQSTPIKIELWRCFWRTAFISANLHTDLHTHTCIYIYVYGLTNMLTCCWKLVLIYIYYVMLIQYVNTLGESIFCVLIWIAVVYLWPSGHSTSFSHVLWWAWSETGEIQDNSVRSYWAFEVHISDTVY